VGNENMKRVTSEAIDNPTTVRGSWSSPSVIFDNCGWTAPCREPLL
jgi:hypothetical protein